MSHQTNRCVITLSILACFAVPIRAADYESGDWVKMTDAQFAAAYADMAFSNSYKDREVVAWLLFARANQLIEDKGGVSESGRVPQWMAWATDSDTFQENPTFEFDKTNRDDLQPVTEKKVLAGMVSVADPNGANEEVTRNEVGYNYLVNKAKLNTFQGVLNYVNAGNTVTMPVGSVEIKASWLRVPDGGEAPAGALTFDFKGGTYWWRGMHIMAKMKNLPKGENLFYSERPSWFWTTFEFNRNPGIAHVRNTLITQRAPLNRKEVTMILELGGIRGFGFQAYAPNGTQIRYTAGGGGSTPVILGHTDMEDFAGTPNTAQPRYWNSFQASCHTCHASAAINPKTKEYFPFSVPTGALTPQYNAANPNSPTKYLGLGYVPLDFMWPIAFKALPSEK